MNPRPYLLAGPAATLLIGLLVCPLLLVIRVSLYQPANGRGFFMPGTWTLANHSALMDAHGLGLVGYTIAFGAMIAVVVVMVSFPLALFLRSLNFSLQRFAIAGITLPKFASVLVILFGLQQLLGDTGPVNRMLLTWGIVSEPLRMMRGLFGALLGEVFLILPYAVILLFVQVLEIDPILESSARGLGASRWQVFRRITLPLAMPGLVLAGQLALVWGMGAFLGPLLLGSPENTTLSVEIQRQAFEYGRWPRAAALSIQLILAIGICLGALTFLHNQVSGRRLGGDR